MHVLIKCRETRYLIAAPRALYFFSSRFFGNVTIDAGHLLSSVFDSCVNFHQLQDIELRLLQDLHLADEAVLERVDSLARFLNITANRFRNTVCMVD